MTWIISKAVARTCRFIRPDHAVSLDSNQTGIGRLLSNSPQGLPTHGVLEELLGIAGAQSGIAHIAHVGGMRGAATPLLHWLHTSREQWLN